MGTDALAVSTLGGEVAGLARSRSVGANVCVGRIERVTVDARDLDRVGRSACLSAQRIFARSHSPQMSRVNTPVYPTEVIDLKASRDGAIKSFPRVNVRADVIGSVPACDGKTSVSVPIVMPAPPPASVCDNASREESLVCADFREKMCASVADDALVVNVVESACVIGAQTSRDRTGRLGEHREVPSGVTRAAATTARPLNFTMARGY